MRFYAICIFVMMSFMANAATCPSGYSELSINENDKIVPMKEQCPDGTTEVYTVSDCASADAGSVCAVCDNGVLGDTGNCVSLCGVGGNKIRFGKKLSFDLLSDRTTKPSLNISMGRGKVCYVGLESGADKGLNFKLPGNRIYHATNASSGGYRVCRAGHTLSYVCNGNTVDKQVITDGGWYTLPSASVCNLPAGKRFGGWYMDDVKQDPYKINTYNYATDKQIIARFLDGSAFYNVNYHCLVNTAPVYTDMATIGANNALKNVCQNSLSGYEQVGWFTPIKPEYINNRLRSWCYDNFDTTGECDTAIEQLTEVMRSPEESWVGFYFGNGNAIFTGEWDVLFWAFMLVLGQQSLIDASSVDEDLATILMCVALYEHTWLDPNLMDVGDVGQQVINTDKDIDLYAIYYKKGPVITYDCGVGGDRYDTLYGDWDAPVYGEGYDLSGACAHGVNNDFLSSGIRRENGCHYIGDWIDGDYYEAKYGDDLIWVYEGNKTVVGAYNCNFTAMFDCGDNGVLKNSGDATLTAEYLRVDGNQRFVLDIVAECVPKEGKEFDGWVHNSSYSTDSLYYSVGDAVDWSEFDYLDGAYFEAVYKDVE